MAFPFKFLSDRVVFLVGVFRAASVKEGAGCPINGSVMVVLPAAGPCAGVKSCVQSRASNPTFMRLTITNITILRLRLFLRAGAGAGAWFSFSISYLSKILKMQTDYCARA